MAIQSPVANLTSYRGDSLIRENSLGRRKHRLPLSATGLIGDVVHQKRVRQSIQFRKLQRIGTGRGGKWNGSRAACCRLALRNSINRRLLSTSPACHAASKPPE